MVKYGWSCGAPACVLGTYAHRMDVQHTFKLASCDTNPEPLVQLVRENRLFPWSGPIDYTDKAVLDHFGIEYDEAEELFGSEGCGDAKTPAAAAKYIKAFVARKIAAEAAKARETAAAKTRRAKAKAGAKSLERRLVMALPTSNAFCQLEQDIGQVSAIKLAYVLLASENAPEAFEMLSGNREGFAERRKCLIVLLDGFRRQGPDDNRDPYVSIQDQAYAYVRHNL